MIPGLMSFFSLVLCLCPFLNLWTETWSSHYSFMKFRSASSHAQCTECIKHKSMIAGLSHHLRARRVQQQMLYDHLQSQFRDRVCYWHLRGKSRARGLEICLIQDGMDQAKFQVPRHPMIRAKSLESFNRPKLHVAATICHGRHVAFYLSEPDVAKDSNTSCEMLMHSLNELAKSGVQLSACRVTLQADNTCREVKNGIVMRLMAALVSDGVILSGRMSFLRSGHSHEDVDQLFGSASTWMKNRVRSALASEDFLIALNEFLQQLDRPHEPTRFCIKLDQTRDWHPDSISQRPSVFLSQPNRAFRW